MKRIVLLVIFLTALLFFGSPVWAVAGGPNKSALEILNKQRDTSDYSPSYERWSGAVIKIQTLFSIPGEFHDQNFSDWEVDRLLSGDSILKNSDETNLISLFPLPTKRQTQDTFYLKIKGHKLAKAGIQKTPKIKDSLDLITTLILLVFLGLLIFVGLRAKISSGYLGTLFFLMIDFPFISLLFGLPELGALLAFILLLVSLLIGLSFLSAQKNIFGGSTLLIVSAIAGCLSILLGPRSPFIKTLSWQYIIFAGGVLGLTILIKLLIKKPKTEGNNS